MVEASDLDHLARQVHQITRDLRRMPAESRKAMDGAARVIGDRIARQIDQAAGGVPRPATRYATRLRRGGIKVQPGRGELKIVIGGRGRSGIGTLTMRQLVWAAEMGGRGRRTTYTQRRPHGTTTVTRRTTMQFGRYTPEGRFIHPTWRREGPRALDDWATAVATVIDDYWTTVGQHV